MSKLKYLKTREVKSPTFNFDENAGIDFYVPDHLTESDLSDLAGYSNMQTLQYIEVMPGESVKIPSGIKVSIPDGYCLLFLNRGSIAAKERLQLGACLVDSSFQGELFYQFYNTSFEPTFIYPNQKIVQAIILPVFAFEIEEETNIDTLYNCKSLRGEGCLGSTNESVGIYER